VVADDLISISTEPKLGLELNLIFVDDGSSDNTAKIIERKITQNSLYASLIKLEKNRGVGIAFLRALDVSKSDLICLVPGDGVFDCKTIINLLKTGQRDCVTLSLRTNRHTTKLTRKFSSKIFAKWFSWLTNNFVPDPHSLFLIPTSAAKIAVNELWGDLPSNTDFRLDNSYHVHFLHKVLTKHPVTNLAKLKVNPQFEKSSSVWNFPFILRFCRTCALMTLKKFKSFEGV
jgi:glycosyltransferase involved in cell wall biosynthesis